MSLLNKLFTIIILAVALPVIAFAEDGPTIDANAADAYFQKMVQEVHDQSTTYTITSYQSAAVKADAISSFTGPTAFTATISDRSYQMPKIAAGGDGAVFLINNGDSSAQASGVGWWILSLSADHENPLWGVNISAYMDPSYLTLDLQQRYLYFADLATGKIVKVDTSTPSTILHATEIATLSAPRGLTIDADGAIYGINGNAIYKISVQGTITTLAGSSQAGSLDGTGSAASFNGPTYIAADVYGNTGAVYVCDTGNYTIRKVIISSGVVTTIAGTAGVQGWADGAASNAKFNVPQGITVDAAGNVYVLDTEPAGNDVWQIGAGDPIRKISNGTVSSLSINSAIGMVVGNGSIPAYTQGKPYLQGMAMDRAGTIFTISNIMNDRDGLLWHVAELDPKAEAPVIADQPLDLTVANSGQAVFMVGALGTEKLLCNWYHDGNLITGATSYAYTISSAQSTDAGKYHVVVTNAFGTVTSNDATLTLGGPVITTQPSSVTVNSGQGTSFSVTATGASLVYQWYKDGGLVAGANSSSYSLTASAAAAGNYHVTVTNAFGAVTSNDATLTVNQQQPPPDSGGGGGGGGGGAPSEWFMGTLLALALVRLRQKFRKV